MFCQTITCGKCIVYQTPQRLGWFEPRHEKSKVCICENKDADQLHVTAKLISAFVFATQIVQSLFFLNMKSRASSYLLWLYSLVCIGPGRKPERWFSHVVADLLFWSENLVLIMSDTQKTANKIFSSESFEMRVVPRKLQIRFSVLKVLKWEWYPENCK